MNNSCSQKVSPIDRRETVLFGKTSDYKLMQPLFWHQLLHDLCHCCAVAVFKRKLFFNFSMVIEVIFLKYILLKNQNGIFSLPTFNFIGLQ